MEYRVGTSGWVYPPWRNTFYPQDLPQKKELFFASRHLSSIEINGSFYSYQKPSTYLHWFSETPDDFVFSVKGPQYITHIARLKNVEIPLANFFASGVLHLREKLGVFLWQLPPNFVFNPEKEERLETFFRLLPRTFADAVKLAGKSERFHGEYSADIAQIKKPLRHAVEVRHHSFENPDFIELLRRNNMALVFADTAGKWPYMEDITSDFLYLRLHGDDTFYSKGYEPEQLRWWSQRLKAWAQGNNPKDSLTLLPPVTGPAKDIFVFFDNDLKIKAPQDAEGLMLLLNEN
ncbi:DUF72 domain-containing protein [Bdellovibrio bacteriovorus]|uniref:DUF72 domain-containing protein n=1 Tax=Bdellovibrio bacteriovorus str. Tiberius TaxID=1069642 RepID=K7YSF4_BDEBC|nr:DUF72 domain-containing protein [Bdellovibrio bacteriovorus]AFY00553.1 hypothetical protein Bdt_0852 [Bdellovibrio bacteriovorus str. Tiberius]